MDWSAALEVYHASIVAEARTCLGETESRGAFLAGGLKGEPHCMMFLAPPRSCCLAPCTTAAVFRVVFNIPLTHLMEYSRVCRTR